MGMQNSTKQKTLHISALMQKYHFLELTPKLHLKKSKIYMYSINLQYYL